MSLFQRFRALLTMTTIAFSGIASTSVAQDAPKNWIVYYANEAEAHQFQDYDLIAFDREEHPPLRALLNQDKTLLGYISFGEAETYRSDFETIKEMGFLMEENPYWPGHFVLDIRNPKWTKYVIEEIIPSLLLQGFDGIMVDTLDSVEELEEKDPEKYKGMIQAAANMIKAVRTHYPDMKIMVNRGFKTLPLIAKDIDYLLAESIMVKHHTDDNDYSLFADEIYQEYLGYIADAKKMAPDLQVVAVDYWDMDDEEGVKHIYATHRKHGLTPYVTTIELDRVDHEPK